MFLREWDTGAGPSGNYVEKEYPDAPIKAFVDWMRNARTQWEQSGDAGFRIIYDKFFKMELALRDHANAVNFAAATAPVVEPEGFKCPDCEKVCKTANALTQHRLTHDRVAA